MRVGAEVKLLFSIIRNIGIRITALFSLFLL